MSTLTDQGVTTSLPRRAAQRLADVPTSLMSSLTRSRSRDSDKQDNEWQFLPALELMEQGVEPPRKPAGSRQQAELCEVIFVE